MSPLSWWCPQSIIAAGKLPKIQKQAIIKNSKVYYSTNVVLQLGTASALTVVFGYHNQNLGNLGPKAGERGGGLKWLWNEDIIGDKGT